MSLKITSRFSPSVLRAAVALETAMAAFDSLHTIAEDKVFACVDVKDRAVEEYTKIWHRMGGTQDVSKQITGAMRELKEDRRFRLQERKKQRMAREAEKQMLLDAGAYL